MSPQPSLREQQRWFATVSTHPDDVSSGAEHASRTLGRAVTPEQWLTAGPSLSAAERLEIYHAGYFGRLVECLADDYRALAHFLGEEGFSDLARAYIRKFPSRSPSLNAYGAEMAAFCRSRSEPWAMFAAELARLEWALVEVIHAPAAQGLAPDTLAKITPDRWQTARLIPSPSLRLLTFDYPANEYLQAFLEDAAPELPERRASATAVFRQGLSLQRMDLEPEAAMLLEDLVLGCPLDSAIAEVSRRSHDVADVAQRLPAWLGSWVANGFFAAIES
jgi:hypothetical protein